MNPSEGLNLKYLGTLFLATLAGFTLAVTAALAQEAKMARVDELMKIVEKAPGGETTIKGVRVTLTPDYLLLRSFGDGETIFRSDIDKDGCVDRIVTILLAIDKIRSCDEPKIIDECTSMKLEPEDYEGDAILGDMAPSVNDAMQKMVNPNKLTPDEKKAVAADAKAMEAFLKRDVKFVDCDSGTVDEINLADENFSVRTVVRSPLTEQEDFVNLVDDLLNP